MRPGTPSHDTVRRAVRTAVQGAVGGLAVALLGLLSTIGAGDLDVLLQPVAIAQMLGTAAVTGAATAAASLLQNWLEDSGTIADRRNAPVVEVRTISCGGTYSIGGYRFSCGQHPNHDGEHRPAGGLAPVGDE